MALNITNKPPVVTEEITLPSSGYLYEGKIPNGILLIKALDWNAERYLFKAIEKGGSNELRSLCEVVKRVAHLPEGFNVESLLESDLHYIILKTRSLSYGESYEFDATCSQCGKTEKVTLRIPDELPTNRFPADCDGLASITTSENNKVDIQFLTVKSVLTCESITRNRIATNLISKESYDDDFATNRIAAHIYAVNGGKPDNLDESRQWLNSISLIERNQIVSFINECTPGINYKIQMVCEFCKDSYELLMPVTVSFFRPKSRENERKLPRGFRSSVYGKDERSEFTSSAGKEILSGAVGGSGEVKSGSNESSASKVETPKKSTNAKSTAV